MKFKNILLLLIILSFTNCNDWLDVNPRQEMKESILYKSEEGFKSTLIGAYLQMGEASLYGRNTSVYFPEMLVHHWTLPTSTGSTNYALGVYDYTYSGVEDLIESIWSKYYKVIVHLNNLLSSFDENVISFTYNNDDMIKGEALGLRAFLHLDLLRYFGPIPQFASADQKTIPYITQMTKNPNLLISHSWAEVIDQLEKDLNDAESFLKDVDPIRTGEDTPEDEWHYLYRENRFNYYAVLATKARFYQWIGDKDNATKYAQMVIDALDESEKPVFKLSDESEYTPGLSSANLIMYSEMIFGVHNSKLQDIMKGLFATESASLTQSPANIRVAFESGQHPDDIRNKDRRYWEEKTYQHSATTNHYYKYIGNELGIAPSNVIPILRLSEMYFILIENLTYSEAIDYFIEYRIARSMSSFIDDELTDKDMLLAQLEKEYRKDFFAEGQMFFYNKRKDIKLLTWPTSFTLPENAYNIPLPKSQTSFE